MAIPLPPLIYQSLVCGPGTESTFEEVGRWLVDLLKRYRMVGAGTVFLDVGCGCGRVARFLMAEPIASYTGIDRHPGMIAWCALELVPRDSRFCFEHIAVRSAYSIWDGSPGEIDADCFVFPYATEHFNSVLLASVFTHMPLHEIRHYLREVKRVLRPGGKVLLSAFFSDTGPSRMHDVNFFHDPEEFLATVAAAGLTAQAHSPHLLYGYKHNWYLVTHAQ